MPKHPLFVLLPLGLAFATAVRAADAPPAPPPALSSAAPAAPDDDTAALKQQLADVRDQLATALHSYSLLEDENTQLKADAEKNAAQLEADRLAIASLQAEVPLAAQAATLRLQARQLQDQMVSLSQEVYSLKTRLALAGPPPAAGAAAPARPAP